MDCLITGEIRENTEEILKQISAKDVFESKVLATWKGSSRKIDIPSDWIILENDDPGPLSDGEAKAKNILRSATLVSHGIELISSKYVFRGRTDIEITNSGYRRLKKYATNEDLRLKLLFDTVGTTTEFYHLSDFCLAGETKVLKSAWRILHERINNNTERLRLYKLLDNSNSQLFHKKRYKTICPAETMNFIFSFYAGELSKCHSLSDIERNLSSVYPNIDFFRLHDFRRGSRLDPRAGVKPLYRYLRGKVSVGGTLGSFIDKFY